MKRNQWMALSLGMALALTMAACSQQEAEETTSPSPDPTNTPAEEEVVESPADAAGTEDETAASLAMTASFQDEAGAALADAAIRFTVGDTEAEYLTDENGTLTVAGLPAEGTVEVVVLDLDGAETASALLELSEGSVTDVTEQGDGTIAVTLLSGTEEIAVSFVQRDDGTLSCALKLSEGSGD